jgi:hypothetical protein
MTLTSPLLSATTEEVFQFNKQFDLKRACSDNGFFCGNSFNCNITLIYPDGTLLKNNELMTNFVSYRNITITQSQNNQLGIIEVIESCNNVSDAGLDTFEIEITADGKPSQIFPTQFFPIILGFLMIAFGLFQERLRLFKHVGSLIIMVMGVITLYPGYSFINWSTLMGQTLGAVFIGLGFYFLIEDSFSRELQEEYYSQDNENNKVKGGKK